MAGNQKKHELCARKVCSPGCTHFPLARAVPFAQRKFQRMIRGLQSPLPLSSSSHIYPCWGIRRRESNYVIFQSAHTNLPYPWCHRAGAFLHLSRWVMSSTWPQLRRPTWGWKKPNRLHSLVSGYTWSLFCLQSWLPKQQEQNLATPHLDVHTFIFIKLQYKFSWECLLIWTCCPMLHVHRSFWTLKSRTGCVIVVCGVLIIF